MRHILTILFCLICFFAVSQPIVQRSNANQTVQDARLKAQLNLFLPIYADTSAALSGTNEGIDSSGGLIYTRNPYAIWYRKNRQWVQLADGGSVGDAWLITGNTPSAGSFVGTTAGGIDLILRSQGLKMADFLGSERIVRLGVLDTTIGGNTNFEIDDTDASDGDLFTGLYKYSKLGQEWGGTYTTYMPSTQGVGNLYNPGNGFLTWNIPGSSGTFPGIDSFTISPPPPSLVTSVCYWIDGAPICYPLAGDSNKVLNDTLFQYFNGDSIPYPVFGNQIFFGDTAIISGDLFCSRKNENDTCILINNNGQYVDSIGINSDSTEYLLFNNDVQIGSFPTLIRITNPEPGSRITLRDSNDTTYIGFNETGLPQSNSYLVSTGGVVLIDSTLTVTAPIYWVYRGADSSELSNQVFTINTAAAGDLRTDIIWIDSLGVFTKTVGIPDSVTAVAPMIDYNGIIVAYADIDGSSITVTAASSFQGNGVVYTQGVGVNNGQAKTDSVNFNYNETTRNLTLSGSFISNVAGYGVRILGGSGIGAFGGSRRMYIDADSFITMRSGGFNYKAELDGQGNFLIGSSGQAKIPSARLAVVDSTKGFLPPVMRGVRMNLISSPATGLIVYNTDSAALCYYNGSAWVKLAAGGGGTSGWGLTGNAGTDPATNFIGTTDNVPFYIRVNNDTIAKFGTNSNNISFGTGTNASGTYSTAMGLNSTASGPVSTVFGQSNIADGVASVAMGGGTSAFGMDAVAMNTSTNATGLSSVSMGSGSTANGAVSTTMGISTIAYGQASTTIGNNTRAYSSNSLSIGRFNLGLGSANDTTVLMEIGNGYNNSNRSNIVTVKYDSIILNLPSKGSGKVLTSDASGNATWQTPSGGSVDTSNFVTKTATQTITGSTTFNNTSVGVANMTVTGGKQGASDNVGLLVNGTFAGATNAHPMRVNATYSPTSNGFAIAAFDAPLVTGGTANHDHIVGYQSVITHGSSGTMTNAYGAYFGYTNNGGTTTNNYGIVVTNPTGSGTITNNVGLFVASQTKGTSNLAIQTAGTTPVEFGGVTYGLGGAIFGHTTGVAPNATVEIRRNGANSFRMRNNANWFQFTQPSSSADISFGSISGNNMKIYDNGNKTFFAPAQDSASNSGLWVNHSFATAYRSSTSTSISINSNDNTFNGDATAGNVTATLPTAVGCKGRMYLIRKIDATANTLSIATTSSQTITGPYYSSSTSFVLYNEGEELQVKSDGANWIIENLLRGGLTTSSAGTLTLKYGRDYIFSGTTATYTLPAIAATVYGRPNSITIKNRGSGAITLNTSAGGNDLYTTTAVNTLTINAGESYTLLPDGTYFNTF